MKQKRLIIIISLFIIVVISAGVFYYINSRFKYNDEGVMGNTNGNLINGGIFCEYEGDVYFANPMDGDKLYKMDMEGKEFEKLNSDETSYISIINGYVYYKKFNQESIKDPLFARYLFAIMRQDLNSSSSKLLHNGKIDCMTVCGNYVYYRYYDDESFFSLRKVKIDGEEDTMITETDYQPIVVSDGKIYFTDVKDTHNLMCLDTKDDSIKIVMTGNIYLPDVDNGFLYYIDLENQRRLTKMNLESGAKTVLTEDSVINYNLAGKYDTIYYQVENKDDHRLCRMTTLGTNIETVIKGDFCKISITEKYTYFTEVVKGEEAGIYKTLTSGVIDVEEFVPPVFED